MSIRKLMIKAKLQDVSTTSCHHFKSHVKCEEINVSIYVRHSNKHVQVQGSVTFLQMLAV